MPKQKRFKTDYPGVYYIEGTSAATGKQERIFYIYYWKAGRKIEEKAGRQIEDAMSPARANSLRADRISGKSLPNTERRALKRQKDNEIVWTLSRLWEEYVANKPQTKGIATDGSRLRKHIKPTLGDKQLREIAPLDLDRLRIHLGKTLKPQTVKHVLGIIKRLSAFGVTRHLCDGINFKITMPKVSNLKTEDLTADQLNNLLGVIDKDNHPDAGDMMKLALFTGMRRGEIFKLKWDDIDFQRNFIRIREPKGGENQLIPMNDSAREILLNRPRLKDSLFVFPGRGGKEMVDIHHALNEIKVKAGLPKDFRAMHGLRHVFASMLASSGQVDMYTLQRLLTHKNPIMTQRYAHLRDESLRRASDLAGKIIQAGAKKEVAVVGENQLK